MIELLILYKLSKKVFTMYGLFNEFRTQLKVLATPSIGTIKPALDRMLAKGFIKAQKSMSSGGRRSTYYSITQHGIEALHSLLLTPLQENPVQFFTTARARIICADVLEKNEQAEMFNLLKNKAENLMLDTKNLLKDENLDFYTKMTFDNLSCECHNLISLLEGMDHACKN